MSLPAGSPIQATDRASVVDGAVQWFIKDSALIHGVQE
jgi:hypothetical protein